MANKIRILIVDDNEDTRYVIQRLLEYEDDLEVIDFATDGNEAIDKVFELKPDVVLMDINMEGLNGIDATLRLRDSAPRTKVVIVSVQDDPNYMREAMRAGAVDFLAKPPRPDDLIQAIKRAYRMIPDEVEVAPPPPTSSGGHAHAGAGDFGSGGDKDGKIISVVGTKGGVGKTTVAVSLAVGLARAAREKSVLLVDSNVISGDVHIFLNTRGNVSVVDAAYMARDNDLEYQEDDTIYLPHDSGIKLLIAPRNPLESDPMPTEAYEKLLGELRKKFDYIVVDTEAHIDNTLIVSMRVSDVIVVMTQAMMPALKDAQVIMSMMRELGIGGESTDEYASGPRVMVALNNYNDATSRIKSAQIGNFLKQKVDIEIAEDPNAVTSLNASRPLIMNDVKQYPSVAGLRALVQEVRKVLEGAPVGQEAVDDDQPSRSGLRKLFGG